MIKDASAALKYFESEVSANGQIYLSTANGT